MCFSCGWTFQASHEKNIKKIPVTPTPQINFVALCQNGSQLFFALHIIAWGAGDFLWFFHARREVFSGNFMFLQNAFFMKNHVTNQFCVIFCQNLCF